MVGWFGAGDVSEGEVSLGVKRSAEDLEWESDFSQIASRMRSLVSIFK